MKKLDVEWSTCSKHPNDVAFAKDLQSMVDKINELVEEGMVDKINELVEEVESLKNRVKK